MTTVTFHSSTMKTLRSVVYKEESQKGARRHGGSWVAWSAHPEEAGRPVSRRMRGAGAWKRVEGPGPPRAQPRHLGMESWPGLARTSSVYKNVPPRGASGNRNSKILSFFSLFATLKNKPFFPF